MVVLATRLTKKVQWPILNNSHTYPFCKTTPGTQLAIAPFLSVKLAQNGRKTTQSVKVRVHQNPLPISKVFMLQIITLFYISWCCVVWCSPVSALNCGAMLLAPIIMAKDPCLPMGLHKANKTLPKRFGLTLKH